MTDFNKILEKAKEIETKFKESQKKIKNISLDFTINLLSDKMINNYFNWNKGCSAYTPQNLGTL